MLEGVIARLLNRWLGKYVLDLDTENLNGGIFSGKVQLTELRLKPEALYELDLPIEVKFGTIGKICIYIPWNALLNQPVVISVEDVHVLAGPIVSGGPYDPERDKRLIRAAKKKVLTTLENDNGDIIGGPDSFPEHLITSLINNLQVTVQNIHIRYEDTVSQSTPLSVGLCISTIMAETTNSRWKASGSPRTPPSQTGTAYHLVKLESVSVYWNPNCKVTDWDYNKQYYIWRNTMTKSLHTFGMDDQDFEFLVKPMTCKIKFIINKSNGGRILKILVDVVLQDLTMQLTREQYLSVCAVTDSLNRMLISRKFISLRPPTPILSNFKQWWIYAYECVLEQRVRPYTWRRILTIRANYRLYRDAYRRVLLNPNDTELKLDLQKYEDNLDIVNVVIARQHALLKLRHEQQNEEDYSGQEKSPSVKNSVWAMLPSPERAQLCKMIGYVETPTSDSGVSTGSQFHQIEHKYNLTIGNFTFSLLNQSREVLVLTLTQLLASIETSPGRRWLKISGRAEGLVLEGANPEDHLVPLISAEHQHCNGVSGNEGDGKASMTPNVFSIDYERCPVGMEGVGCRLWCSLEAVGIVFHTHAVAELLEFLNGGDLGSQKIETNDRLFIREVPNTIISAIRCALDKRVDLNLDIRVPYIVIPEYGASNRSGSQLILDLGRLIVKTELAPLGDIASLEDATQNELEEQLYSRVHVDLFQMQLLFCDSGENWRDARREIDTDMHLISKMNMLIVFSHCIRSPNESGGLPEYKFNVSVPSLKINVSERKIVMFLTFLEHVGLLFSEHWIKCAKLWEASKGVVRRTIYPKDLVVGKLSIMKLCEVRTSVRAPWRHRPPTCRLAAVRSSRRPSDLPPMVTTERSSTEPSEHSEDASEAWARCVDLPGLEDNVSPSNTIRGLSRFVLGEFCILLCRSSERVDRPYLMLRVDKICADLATMDYGPAIQISVGAVSLTDKMHTSPTGQYLDLIHVPMPIDNNLHKQDLLQVLYRKVRANCPDFRSHFHSVEKSLVSDVGPINLVIHRDALRTLIKYIRYLYDKITKHEKLLLDLKKMWDSFSKLLRQGVKPDPPVPPGAVKFSYSVRFACVTSRLCDTDSDLLEIKMTGLETDLMFRANERMVLRSYLTGLTIDHLAEVTLYTRVLTIDEDKVFEIKYVRHAPCICRSSDVGHLTGVHARNDAPVTTDGSLRVHVGRVQITLLYKLALQLKRFIEPLIPTGKIRMSALNYLNEMTIGRIKTAINSGNRLQLGLYLHGPTILLPQKTASPNLVVLHTGELTVENFFKEYGGLVVENILVRAEGATIVRAVMTLAASLEMQEVMLEPLNIRLDVKRSITLPRSAVPISVVPKPPPWEIDGVIDSIKITIGQRDLSTLLAVYADNVSEGLFVDLSPDVATSRNIDSAPITPPSSPTLYNDDSDNVKSLEVFFCQGEAKHKELTLKIFLEELQVSLFSDCEELLSSPVRDFSRGLCRLDVGEINLSGEVFNDGGLEAKLSVRSIQVEDIRPDCAHGSPGIARILHAVRSSNASATGIDTLSQQISISMPPVVDISFHQNRTGDQFIDVIMERICLQLSVPFVVAFTKFLFDSMPCTKKMDVGGVINHGYVGDGDPPERNKRPTAGLTVALRMCRPELIFHGGTSIDDTFDRTSSIITRSEVLVDYSRHSLRENLTVSLSNFHILFTGSGAVTRKHNEPYVVLHPCDLEYSRNYRAEEDGTRANTSISAVQIHICPGLVHTITNLFEELTFRLNLSNLNNDAFEKNLEHEDDLWVPKRMSRVYGSGGDDSGIDADENLVFGEIEPEKENGETVLVASAQSISIILEVNSRVTVPVFLFQISAEATLHDWNGGRAHGTVELHIQSNYFNGLTGKWEPFIEPVPTPDGTHRPWQLLVRAFRDATAVPNLPEVERRSNGAKKKEKNPKSGSSSGSGDEEGEGENSDAGEGMVFLRAPTSSVDKSSTRVTASLAAFLEDSDTETEDSGTMERLASAICDLFTGDWNESDGESDGHSSESEQENENDNDNDSPGGDSGETALERCRRPDSRSGTGLMRKTSYLLIDSRDILNLTVTNETLQLVRQIWEEYTNVNLQIIGLPLDSGAVRIVNDIGPGARIELLRKTDGDKPVLVCSRTFEKLDSPACSPDDSDISDNGSVVDSNDGSLTKLKLDCDWSHYDKDPLLASLQFTTPSTNMIYKFINQEQIKIQVPGFNSIVTSCPPDRTWSKLLKLEPSFKNHRYHVFIQHRTSAISGRLITVRSPLQIRNETCHALAIFYEIAAMQQLGLEAVGEIVNPFGGTVRIAVLEPQDTFNIPIHLAYHCRLHVRPVGADGHHLRLRTLNSGGIWWPELVSELGVPRDIRCDDERSSDEEDNVNSFTLRAYATEGPAHISNKSIAKSIPYYLIHVVAPLCLRNRLPYGMVVTFGNTDTNKKITHRIEAGERITSYIFDCRKPLKIYIELGYLGLVWKGSVTLTEDMTDDRLITMATEHDTDGGNKHLTIALKVTRRDTIVTHFYCPYWIVNRTGLPLQIRGASSVVYDSQGEAPLLYVHRRKRQGQRKTVRIRVYQSNWSAEFSLDAVGTAGLVVCKDKERARRYSILAKCVASKCSPRLTRIIKLLPNWLVCNNTNKHLRYMELNERTDLWLDLGPADCVPFWPETTAQLMCIKYRDGRVPSPAFSIGSAHQVTLRMDGGGSITVDVSGGGERPLLISFRPYRPGDAPVRVDNACADLYLKVCQKSTGHVTLLSPYHSLLYTWDDPTAERTLIWNVYNNRGAGNQIDVKKDANGEVKVSVHVIRPPANAQTQKSSSSSATDSDDDVNENNVNNNKQPQQQIKRKPPTARTDKIIVYWVCYMDGCQRTLLLTQERRIAEERAINSLNSKVYCYSFAGLGISLCTGGPGGGDHELLHFSLCDSPPIWEVYIAHRWKTLTLELASWLEDKFRSQQKRCQLKDYVLIDLEKMYMLKPFYGELRRIYHPAVLVEDRSTRQMRQFRFAVNCLQIDGGDAHSGPTNIFKFAPPMNNSSTGNLHLHNLPCIELKCVARKTAINNNICNITAFEKIHFNIHEFEANFDSRLIERVKELLFDNVDIIFNSLKIGHDEFKKDMMFVRSPLCYPIDKIDTTVTLSEMIVSPIKFKVGLFSPSTHRYFPKRLGMLNYDPDRFSNLPPLLEYVYGCLEAAFTPPAANLNFIVSNLDLHHKSSKSLSQLWEDLVAHYLSTFMQQFHVQILGADVLLNPFGMGEDNTLTKMPSVEATSESNIYEENYIIEPDWWKTARCLMGHLHGPTTLLLTLCTGEHLLRYSLEADRRRKSRYTPPVPPHLPETVILSSQTSFAYGVTLSLYGLFHRSELEAFFRGPGRALASLMGSIRSGGNTSVADCAAVSLDAIKRAGFLGERSVGLVRQRLIRHIDQSYLGLRFYSQHEAVGKVLLGLVSGGQYSGETYWAHAPLTAEGKNILLISMQHVLMVENVRLWGPWDVQWALELDEIMSVPKIIDGSIIISVRNIPDSQHEDLPDTHNYKISGEPDVLSWLRERIEQAMVISMEDKCWTEEN